jgi:transmembrane sensor
MTEIDWELLFRYAGDECTAEERERFERWLAADPAHRAVLDAAATAAGRVLDRMPASAPPLRVLMPRRRTAVRTTWALAAAASLLVAAGSTLVWRTLDRAGAAGARTATSLAVATTERGQRETLRLADGTRVVLGAASTLRYPADFMGRSRDVYLEGEGYFEVRHDARRPFRVHAGGATAEDLGTTFGVRAYAEDRAVRVVVAEGMVALGPAASHGARGRVLTRGELGRLPRGETTASVQRVNVDAYLGWTTGRLDFDETPLPEVVAQLGRWYDARFRIADSSLASRRLTASFTDRSLGEVLAVLAPALDVRFERAGDSVVVRAAARGR